MSATPISVLAIGLADDDLRSLDADEGVEVERMDALPDDPHAADVLVLALADGAPLEAVGRARAAAPDAGIVVVTSPADAADGSIALHAGAEEHLVLDDAFAILLPRAVRYASKANWLRRNLSTVDEITELPNLRGFAPIAEHQLRVADRGEQPVVFVFVRLEDFARRRREEGATQADALVRDAAAVVLEAVRDADVPARIASDTFAVLLTGDATGAESLVLSRLVEAIAVHDAARETPRSLALSVGTARYEPGSGLGLAEILESATRGLAARA
ncbi:MAG TPA: GGDEF domain-containing protein [Actinomycetota bacterium]